MNQKIEKAFDDICKAIEEEKESLSAVKGPDLAKKQSYEETLKQFEEYRGVSLWHSYLGTGRGNGVFVELADGSVKYDFISGIGAHFGHRHPLLIKSSLESALSNTIMQGNLQQNVDAFELTQILIKASGFDHCFLSTSGATANENAFKIIFQKKCPKSRVLTFEKCFAGRTLFLSQITDKPDFREGLPRNVFVDYIPFYDWKEPEKSQKRALESLKKTIKRYPNEHACMCLELIQGESGYYPGSREFFFALFDVLKENDIAIFVDEVQSFGRTENLFAFQNFGLHKDVDVVTVGKLLQGGATLFRKEYKPKAGLISQTFIGSTSSIKGGIAILKSLLNDGYLGPTGKIREIRNYFVNKLKALSETHSDIFEGPFGYGLMIAFTPFKGDREKVIRFAKDLFEAGVITFTAGQNPTRIRMLVPAGSVTLQDIDQVCRIIETTLMEAI